MKLKTTPFDPAKYLDDEEAIAAYLSDMMDAYEDDSSYTGEYDAYFTTDTSASGAEDTLISGAVTASDVDGDALSFALGTGPTRCVEKLGARFIVRRRKH